MTSSELPNYAPTSYSFTFVGSDPSSSITATESPSPSTTSASEMSSTKNATPSASPTITSAAAQVSSTPTAALGTLATSSHVRGISGGAIAAAVIVPIVVIGGAIVAFLLFRRKRRNHRRDTTSTTSSFGDRGISRDTEKEDYSAAAAVIEKEEFNTSRAASPNGVFQAPPMQQTSTSIPRTSLGSAYRATSRMTERRSMSTIRTDHPPTLPPVDTSFSFVRSVSNDALRKAAATRVLTRGDSTSTSSTNVDPFLTPSPSSAHTRHPSSVLSRSESGVSRGDHYQSQLASHAEAAMPVFEWRRASASPTSSPLTREAPTFPPPTPTHTSLLRRPSLTTRAISNTSANTVTSTRPSITPSTAAEFDYNDADGDYAEIVEPSVAEAVAMPLHRANLGGGGRASVIDLNAAHAAAGSVGRHGSGSSWVTLSASNEAK